MEEIVRLWSTVSEGFETVSQYVKLLALLVFGALFVSSLFRFIFGKKAQLNKAVSATVEIFCLYALNIVIYGMGLEWELFLSPLPFVTLENDTLLLFPILSSDLTAICGQILRVLVIAFLVNILNDIIPEGERFFTWYFFRILTVVLAVGANYLADLLFTALLPANVMEIAPTILLISLAALILLGSLKFIVGFALIFVDPIIAALYTFFFATFVGRELARAMVTTALLSLLVVVLDILEITAVAVTSAALTAYIPILVAVLALWYVIGHIL